MELRRYGAIALHWWWLFLTSALIAGGAAWYVSSLQPKIYRASALVLINQSRGVQGIDYNSLLLSQRLTATYAELITQPPVLSAALEKTGVAIDLKELNKRLQVKVVRDTQLLELSVDNPSPQQARDLTNAIAQIFVSQQIADQLGSNAPAREVLQQQTDSLKEDIANTSQALERAKGTNQAAAGASSGGIESAEVTRLQALLAQQQVTYSQLLRDQSQLALSEAQVTNSLKVVVPAALPLEPISPNVPRNIVLATVIGLLLAFGGVFLHEYLDDTIKGEGDIQTATELSTLAIVARAPRKPGEGKPGEAARLYDDSTAKTSLSEAYRTLRANVDFAWAGEAGQTIVVTSASPEEGKTTTVANLGAVLAEDGRRVILVDADLRRPALHKVFGISAVPGLSSLLANPHADVDAYLVATGRANLWVVPAGPVPPNPSELLGSTRFAEVLEQLRRRAEVILIDTPPTLGVIDSAVAATRGEGVLIVTEAGRTRSEALARTVDALARTPARLLGVVLNKVGEHAGGHYYYQYYHRYYADGTKSAGPATSTGAKPAGSPNGTAADRP